MERETKTLVFTDLEGSTRLGTRPGDDVPGTATPRLKVRLLGSATVSFGREPLNQFATPRLQRLLAHLTVARDVAVNRGHLAFELWPDSTEAQARTNLRKLLHELRRALPDAERYVDIDSQTIRWRHDAPADVDLVALTEAFEHDDPIAAANAYGGDLLPGCYDDWTLRERDRLQTQAIETLRRLATRATEAGDDLGTIEYAQQLLRLDPLCEEAYRWSMEAHARRGDRAEALRTYHRCVDVLERELGVEPDITTRELYSVQLAGAGAPTAPTLAPGPTAGRAPLVGRATEQAVAEQVWRSAATGRAHVLLVSGEPGIGKSRLVDELARTVAAEGNAVARTRAYEAGGRLPWGPVVDWLRGEALRRNVEELDPAWLADLSRILPEVRADRPDLVAAPGIGDDRRYQLFDAIAKVVLAQPTPLLLVVDDLQWADADTLELIGFLIRHGSEAPLLIAATARSEEVEPGCALETLTSALGQNETLTELALEPLDTGATAQLAAHLTGNVLDRDASEQLWKETEGNPLFVVEAVRAGLAGGDEHPSLTPTVQAVIRARLAGLTPQAHELVEAAATIGRGFTVEALAAAVGVREDDLVDALDDLWRRRIIREQGTGYDFTHDKLREVAHAAITPPRRRRLHRVVAGVLSSLHCADLGSVSADLAAHYEQAGLETEAIEAYRRAAAHAIGVFAFDDAIASIKRALALLEQLPGGTERDATELDLRVTLGVPQVVRDGYGALSSQESYERSRTLCRRLGRPVDPPILRGLGLASLVQCRFDRSISFAQELLDQADTDPIAAVEGHYLTGVSEFWRANFGESRRHLEAVLATYRPEHTAEHLDRYAQDPKAVCTVRLALTRLWGGDAQFAAKRSAEAVELAEHLDHPPTYGYVLPYAAMIAAELGDRDALAGRVHSAEALYARHAQTFMASLVRLLRGWLEVLVCPNSLERLEAAVNEWRTRDQALHLTHGLVLLTRASLLTGSLEIGQSALREGIEWGRAHDQRYYEAEFWRLDGELRNAAGDPTAAKHSLRRALAVADAQGARWLYERANQSLDRMSGVP